MKFLLYLICVILFVYYAHGQGVSGWLNSLPTDVKQEFDAVLSNQTLTKGEINQQLDELASQQQEPFNSQYNDSKQAFETAKTFMDNIHAAKMANCSAEAQAADVQIVAVRNDMNITRNEEFRRIQAIIDAQPESVQNELNENAPYTQTGKRK